MTNPNNAVGTNGAFGGRTSVNAFNDVLGAFQSTGALNGWGIAPSSGMTVACGGNGTTRDVAIAEDTNGNKTTINNISGSPINVTLDSAPASNSRYDAIVVYVDKPPTGNATQDNPECCGIIKVTGTAASTPAYPDDGAIRSAITADGASGATAYYAIISYILVASGTTTITSGMISSGPRATIGGNQIANGAITSAKTNFTISNVTITIAGKSVTAPMLNLGNGVAIVGCHAVISGVTTSSSVTTVAFSGIPSMQVISCGVEAMQIGQATSYASYQHFYAAGTGGNFYIRNTTAGTNSSLEVNLHVIGKLN